MPDRREVVDLLLGAHAERSVTKAKQMLSNAVRLCDVWGMEGGSTEAIILKAQALAELAYEQDDAVGRAAQWKSSLDVLDEGWQLEKRAELAESYASLAVDCYQDELSDMDSAQRQRMLRGARDRLDEALLLPSLDNVATADLLARKSSVLRHLAISDLTADARKRRLEEAFRSAERGAQLSKTAATILELGLSEWALARFEPTDDDYIQRLRKAETYFKDEALANFEPAELTLSNFYRSNFRAAEACEAFLRSASRVRHIRRLLRDSYIYAEAATQAWWAQHPKSFTELHLTEARTLLEAALAGGSRTARLVVGLAFVRAILEGPAEGETALNDICLGPNRVSWDRALALTQKATMSDVATYGLALGLNRSGVWSRLGTFALVFLKKPEQAETLYRTATRVNPHDAIAATNLARFLARNDDPGSLSEARRLLQKASQFADRRFVWWRAVLAEVQQKEAAGGRTTRVVIPKLRERIPPGPAHFKKLEQLKDRLRLVESLKNPHDRGYELEALFYALGELTLPTAAGPYSITRKEGDRVQIDGYIEHNVDKYRVECKWEKQGADGDDVASFLTRRLDVAGISGLFVSMEGFKDSAVNEARRALASRPILLMDGDEVRAVFGMRINFDQFLTIKRLYVDRNSDPYHRVVTLSELG